MAWLLERGQCAPRTAKMPRGFTQREAAVNRALCNAASVRALVATVAAAPPLTPVQAVTAIHRAAVHVEHLPPARRPTARRLVEDLRATPGGGIQRFIVASPWMVVFRQSTYCLWFSSFLSAKTCYRLQPGRWAQTLVERHALCDVDRARDIC